MPLSQSQPRGHHPPRKSDMARMPHTPAWTGDNGAFRKRTSFFKIEFSGAPGEATTERIVSPSISQKSLARQTSRTFQPHDAATNAEFHARLEEFQRTFFTDPLDSPSKVGPIMSPGAVAPTLPMPHASMQPHQQSPAPVRRSNSSHFSPSLNATTSNKNLASTTPDRQTSTQGLTTQFSTPARSSPAALRPAAPLIDPGTTTHGTLFTPSKGHGGGEELGVPPLLSPVRTWKR